MIKKNDVLELEITGYAFEGKGIAKISMDDTQPDKKFTIFVEGSYPGDRVRAFIKKKKSSFAEANTDEIIQASADRISPVCDYFGMCGGCKQQNLNYQTQLKYKHQQVKETFEHVGKLSDFVMEDILASDSLFHYRNKMEYTFCNKRWVPKAEMISTEEVNRDFALGMHIPRIFDKVLDIHKCYLHPQINDEIFNFSREFFTERNIEPYGVKTHSGFLRNLVIRNSFSTGDIMINLVTSDEDDKLLKEYTEQIINKFPNVKTIINNKNQKLSQVALGDYEIVYYGDGHIFDSIGKMKYRISANSFFQTNTVQAEKLYQTALDYSGITSEDIVYDLYSGAGTISIYVSENAKKVFGFETVTPAIKDAIVNAKTNNINNVDFIEADLNKSFLSIIESKKLPKPDIIIADPPRSGMNPRTVSDIIALSPKRVVYVSCNPATQARDINGLTEGGYKLIKTRPVDMFPQTFHIENVALLEK